MVDDVVSMLKSVGAIITDSHIVYTSGKHGSVYVNKDALYPHTELASRVGKMFAEKNKKLDIDAVVAPALGGIILSQWTAYYLSKPKKMLKKIRYLHGDMTSL
jgi:orotate phosphoribosyltransferase